MTEMPLLNDNISMPFLPISNPHTSEKKGWPGITSELSCDEAASLVDHDRPCIGYGHFFSIKRANGDSIFLSLPCMEKFSSSRLHVTQTPSRSDAASISQFRSAVNDNEKKTLFDEYLINSDRSDAGLLALEGLVGKSSPLIFQPSLDNYDFSSRAVDDALMSNNDFKICDVWPSIVAVGSEESSIDPPVAVSDQISRVIHDQSTSPPCPYAMNSDTGGSQVAEVSFALIDDVNPCHAHPSIPQFSKATCADGSVRSDNDPCSATYSLCISSQSINEQQGSTCIHGRRRTRCKDCQGTYICSHGRVKSQCRYCGGASFCVHGRRRTACKDCGGSLFCSHGRQKSRCKDCGGVSICPHDRRRSQCRECGGASVCCHGRRKSTCKACGGASICVHSRQRAQCKECARTRRPQAAGDADN